MESSSGLSPDMAENHFARGSFVWKDGAPPNKKRRPLRTGVMTSQQPTADLSRWRAVTGGWTITGRWTIAIALPAVIARPHRHLVTLGVHALQVSLIIAALCLVVRR